MKIIAFIIFISAGVLFIINGFSESDNLIQQIYLMLSVIAGLISINCGINTIK